MTYIVWRVSVCWRCIVLAQPLRLPLLFGPWSTTSSTSTLFSSHTSRGALLLKLLQLSSTYEKGNNRRVKKLQQTIPDCQKSIPSAIYFTKLNYSIKLPLNPAVGLFPTFNQPHTLLTSNCWRVNLTELGDINLGLPENWDGLLPISDNTQKIRFQM